MSNLIIEKLLAKTRRTDIPAFRPGDTVRVHVKIKEGDKERVQAFEGVVIKRDNGPQASFTVRKISFGQHSITAQNPDDAEDQNDNDVGQRKLPQKTEIKNDSCPDEDFENHQETALR